MDGATRILKVMQRQAGKRGPELVLGSIGSSGELRIGGLKIDQGDYEKNESLKLKEGDTVVCGKIEGEYVILCVI